MSATSSIGTNLAAINYWSTEFPFIDRVKSAGAWVPANAAGGMTVPVALDANGYPTAIPTGATILYTMIPLDPPSAGTTNIYELTYTGTATFRIQGATIISSAPGKIVFKYTGTSSMDQLIVNSINSADPLSSLHIVRQDQVADFNAGKIFNPALLDKLSAFDTLRFMDWGNINNSTIESWSNRTTMNSMSWSLSNVNGSVPIEAMVQLANETHKNMWLNVPTRADDNYVTQMLQYVKDHLDPTLKVNLEYSNEMWNWGFQQTRYARDMANSLWGTDVNGDGVIDPNSSAEAAPGGFEQYYGYRSAQIAAIAKQVFGASAATQLDVVLGVQTVYAGLERYIFAGVARAGLGTVASLFGDYAVTTYFGGDLSGGTASDRAKILSWARSGAVGMDAAFHELEFGGSLDTSGSLAWVAQFYTYQASVARQNGLKLVAYEGGLGLTASGFSAADQPTVLAFFTALENDPRMATLYAKMISDFSAAGGTLLNAYTDAQFDRAAGNYGTLKSIYDTTSPAYEALKAAQILAARGAPAPVLTPVPTTPAAATPANPTPANPTPVANQTSNANYNFNSTDTAITYAGTAMFTANGNALDNVITGGNAGNRLSGGSGRDLLTGGTGADYLDGGVGVDTMIGKGGNDTYIVDNAGDIVTEAAGEGVDEVRTTLAAYALGANVENLTYTGTTAFTGTGNALANVITGGAGNDTLYGNDGDDTLVGGAGNDLLDGGTGKDTMSGGLGNDSYVVDDAGDVVTELAGQGTDEIRTSLATYALGANLENLSYTGTAKFTGTGNALANVLTAGNGGSVLYGGDGNDTLNGGSGIDWLDGGTGADKLIGGGGNDTYIVDNAGDVVTEGVNGGTDEVRTTLSLYGLTANVENLTFTGSGAFTGGGNALANVITGGAGVNRLYGNEGNDTLIGGASNDQLDGGAGADLMTGGAGDDSYYVDNPGDVIVEKAGGGTDSVFATASYTLGANVEHLRLMGTGAIDGTGNDLANNLVGNAAANRLSGAGGNDLIMAGDGDDRLDGGSGDDTLMGEGGNDYILGGTGNDLLNGGAGNDTLVGGAGADSLTGGAGADRFVFGPGDLAVSATLSDKILDFSRADGDKIDLTGYDANTATAARDAFRFIGTGAFTRHAGELRIDTSGYYAVVSGDLNGDGVADFALNVSKGSGALITSDFIL